jgi:hypothetical protein
MSPLRAEFSRDITLLGEIQHGSMPRSPPPRPNSAETCGPHFTHRSPAASRMTAASDRTRKGKGDVSDSDDGPAPATAAATPTGRFMPDAASLASAWQRGGSPYSVKMGPSPASGVSRGAGGGAAARHASLAKLRQQRLLEQQQRRRRADVGSGQGKEDERPAALRQGKEDERSKSAAALLPHASPKASFPASLDRNPVYSKSTLVAETGVRVQDISDNRLADVMQRDQGLWGPWSGVAASGPGSGPDSVLGAPYQLPVSDGEGGALSRAKASLSALTMRLGSDSRVIV